MNFQIEKPEFLRGLNLVQSVTGRKTTLPILSHVLLELKESRLYLTATDLETGICEELLAKAFEEGKASVSAKKLYEIVRELPEETIHIQKKENQWIAIKCGKSVFNLAGLDPDEFPSLPAYQEEYFSKISSRQWREMIEKTVFAASNEESRYHLNGVFVLQRKSEILLGEASYKGISEYQVIRMVATDGHRLSLIDRVLTGSPIGDPDGKGQGIRGIEKGIILPKKGVLEIKKMIQEKADEEMIEIYFDSTHGFIKVGGSLMVIRLIDGEFPEYDQVIPKENDKRFIMDKEKVYSCLRRVSTMANERVEGVKLFLKKDSIEFSSYHQDYGDAKEEIEVLYEGPPLEVGFNARYLMEALNAIDTDQVYMELKDEGSPGIIKPSAPKDQSSQIYIIMPMRI